MLSGGQLQPLPHINERLGKRINQPVIMIRTGRDAQPFRALRHRRIIDGLDIDAVVGEQQIACLLAALRIADENWNDVTRAMHHWQRRSCEHRLGARGAILVALALPLRGRSSLNKCEL